MERHAVAMAFNDKYEVDLGDLDGTGRLGSYDSLLLIMQLMLCVLYM